LADTGAIGETGGANTFAGSADHTASAFSAAVSAVIWIAFGIDAGAGASGLSGGAIEDTHAIGAELTRCAFVIASSAVFEIYFEVATDTRAIRESRGASTRAIGTEFAAGAFDTTVSAVIWIAFGIDAGAGASGLSGGAVEYALAVRAELTGGAFITTGSTVFEIGFEIAA
jgi:hypothetical protein